MKEGPSGHNGQNHWIVHSEVTPDGKEMFTMVGPFSKSVADQVAEETHGISMKESVNLDTGDAILDST